MIVAVETGSAETRAVGGRGDGYSDARTAALGGADAVGVRAWRVRLELPVERETDAADGADAADALQRLVEDTDRRTGR